MLQAPDLSPSKGPLVSPSSATALSSRLTPAQRRKHRASRTPSPTANKKRPTGDASAGSSPAQGASTRVLSPSPRPRRFINDNHDEEEDLSPSPLPAALHPPSDQYINSTTYQAGGSATERANTANYDSDTPLGPEDSDVDDFDFISDSEAMDVSDRLDPLLSDGENNRRLAARADRWQKRYDKQRRTGKSVHQRDEIFREKQRKKYAAPLYPRGSSSTNSSPINPPFPVTPRRAAPPSASTPTTSNPNINRNGYPSSLNAKPVSVNGSDADSDSEHNTNASSDRPARMFLNLDGSELKLEAIWDRINGLERDETWTLMLTSVPAQTSYSTLVNFYANLPSFDHTASRIRDSTGHAYIVFTTKEGFDQARAACPPCGLIAMDANYDPRRITDDFFRTFLSFDSSRPTHIIKENLRAALDHAYGNPPESLNVNEKASCVSAYWNGESAWLRSHQQPETAVKIMYTADQVEQLGGSVYFLQANVVDWDRALLCRAAKTDGPFIIVPPPKPESDGSTPSLSKTQANNCEAARRILGPNYFSFNQHNNKDNVDEDKGEGIFFFPGKDAETLIPACLSSYRGPIQVLPHLEIRQFPPTETVPILNIALVDWVALLEEESARDEALPTHPATYVTVLCSFAATNHRSWFKLFVRGFPTNTYEKTARRVLSEICKDIQIFGLQRRRESNLSNGFGFIYVKGAELAAKLAVFRAEGERAKTIEFDYAKPRSSGAPPSTNSCRGRRRGRTNAV